MHIIVSEMAKSKGHLISFQYIPTYGVENIGLFSCEALLLMVTTEFDL